ncbi:MAG TPA: FtsX-like permease family protein [Solirubrobacteraceae bacterium]|nr:FtsX-like permease family protein [Solirubrobacteraceae bacterium]
MWRLVARGMVRRKLRVALTAIAIALGVALMAGTYILTDTINQAFAGIFHTAEANKSVIVTPTEALGRQTGSEAAPITDATIARVRAVPGVAQAAGGIVTPAALLSADGKRLSAGHSGGLVASVVPPRFESFTIKKGRFPTAAHEVAIDAATAQRNSLKLGDQIKIAASAPVATYTIVGVVDFGSGESLGGASAAVLVPEEVQRIDGEPGRYSHIDVAAKPGVSDEELRRRVRAALPDTFTVRTGAQEAKHETENLESDLGFLRTFLLIFAYVALVVGAFIIFNTFSITVAQRAREFGLLRTLGASRRQLLRSVVEEGLLLGIIGAAIGLLGGIALAPALNALFKSFGADLPDNGTVLETRTIVVSLLVGVGVTVLAGLPAAMRATRVPPIAAMREGVEIPRRPLPKKRTLVIRFVVGLVLVLALGRITGARGAFGLLAIVWVVRGAVLWTRLRREGERPARHYRIVPALASGIGALLSWRGITARLARENSVRQPGRTLVTAAALTVGLALVTFVAVLADSAKTTIHQVESRSFKGDLIIESSSRGGGVGVPATLAPVVARVPGVASTSQIAFTEGRLHGKTSNATVTAVEPESFVRTWKVEWVHGSQATLATLGEDGAIVSKEFAKSEHITVGQHLLVLTPTDRHVTLVVRGEAQDTAGLLRDLTIPMALARTQFGERSNGLVFVTYKPGVSNAQVQPVVNRLLASYFPQTQSKTAAQFEKEQSEGVNTLLELIYVLLALSVIVSLFGIVNTLILSIYERTHELGMMRAIGTSRRQIRQMIRYESLITAMIGGILGLVIGVVGAVVIVALTLSGSGFVIAVPGGTLVVLLVVAALAGLLAAQLPARRAARLDVLSALASE